MNNLKPYIGITGLTERSQTDYLLDQTYQLGWPYSRKLMLGYLVGYKGLAFGEIANPEQYIPRNNIESVMLTNEHAMNIIHYNSRASGLYLQLSDLLRPMQLVDGVQLNIAWPAVAQLRRFRRWNYCRVILQLGRTSVRLIAGDCRLLVDRLRPYEQFIDYVLIDMSDGNGIHFDLKLAEQMITALVLSGLDIRWAVAGGLSAGGVERLAPLLDIYPELSWDATGKLRDRADKLDPGACRAYLESSLGMARRFGAFELEA